MLATIPIFFHNNWPRKFLNRYVPKWLYKEEPLQYSSSCLYSKEEIKPEEAKNQTLKSKIANATSVKNAPVKSKFRHKFFTIFAILYLAEQGFLPYSHFVTKGYNNWTNVSFFYPRDLKTNVFLGFIWLFMGYDDTHMAYVRIALHQFRFNCFFSLVNMSK